MHNCTYAYPSNCARRKIGFLQDVAATSCDAFPDMFDVYLYLVVNRVRHNLLWITMDSNYLKILIDQGGPNALCTYVYT